MESRATERDLVLELKAAREQTADIEAKLAEAREREAKAETAIIELLEANNADATAHYEGVGHYKRMRPRLYANVTKENQAKLFDFLAEIGRTDLIKEAVAPQTLSTFVKERIENGEKVPEFIGYYLKNTLRLFE